jgi:hypothetical protein
LTLLRLACYAFFATALEMLGAVRRQVQDPASFFLIAGLGRKPSEAGRRQIFS